MPGLGKIGSAALLIIQNVGVPVGPFDSAYPEHLKVPPQECLNRQAAQCAIALTRHIDGFNPDDHLPHADALHAVVSNGHNYVECHTIMSTAGMHLNAASEVCRTASLPTAPPWARQASAESK